MNKMRRPFNPFGLLGLASGFVILFAIEFALSGVPFVRDCQGKDIGSWEFGEASDGCDASRYGSVSRIKYIFSEFVFDRSESDNIDRRKDYVTNVYALLRDLSSSYLRSRKPDVQADEVKAFVVAIAAVAHQETFWSHYRIAAKGGYKLATGDRNISHGMMQINQRYHASREQDRSFDIVGNISFGIEHYYREWEAAQNSKCIHRSKNQTREQTLENISRAAYSSYNGGPSAICRWTNPGHLWAKNDRNYLKKLKGQDWMNFVRDENLQLQVNLNCVRSGDDLCAIAKERRREYLTGRPLIMTDGSTCITSDGLVMQCATDVRVFTCLQGPSENMNVATPLKIKTADHELVKMPREYRENRMELCARNFPEIGLIGDIVTTKVSLAIRSEVGGRTIGFAKKDQSFQILDIEFGEGSEHFYRIRLPNKIEGWISGGNQISMAKTLSIFRQTEISSERMFARWLPANGTRVEIVKADGLSLLFAPESSENRLGRSVGQSKLTLAKGAIVDVLDVQYLGAANEIWLKVKTSNETGFIYAGRTYPTVTIEEWVKVLK